MGSHKNQPVHFALLKNPMKDAVKSFLKVIFGNAMMKRFAALFLAAFAASSLTAASVEISMKAGAQFSYKYRAGLISLKLIPQIAVWIEDTEGNFIETLLVTHKSAKAKWGVPGASRPEALPVWAHRYNKPYNGSFMPTPKTPLPDVITGATPSGDFKKMLALPPLAPGKYRVFVEVNNSFDFNESYKKDTRKNSISYNAVNGQPSLVYVSEIDTSVLGARGMFTLQGRGDMTGKTGALSEDLSGITSAKQIISSIEVLYVP